jgi:hypothetical protein
MGRVLGVALVSVGILALSATPCWACSCVYQPPKAQAAGADVIFTGRVIEAEDPFRFSGPRVQAEMAVEVLYKGDVGTEVVVETYRGGEAACGLEFVEDERFTIFAFRNERGRLETNICSASTTGTIDPGEFGLSRGTAPPGGIRQPSGEASETGAGEPNVPWLAVGAVALVASAAGVALAIRLRRSGKDA